MKNNNKIFQLTTTVVGCFLFLLLIIQFNHFILPGLPLGIKAFLVFVLRGTLLIPPLIAMAISKERFSNLGFSKNKIFFQIIIGVIIGLIMCFFFTVIPILLGFKEYIGSTSYDEIGEFIYEFFYLILTVGFVEEFIFRGFIFYRLLKIKDSKLFAIIISSILFGLFHIFNGNIIQIFTTALIGALFCLCREKIKKCTIISLVVAHGLYEFLIVLLISIF